MKKLAIAIVAGVAFCACSGPRLRKSADLAEAQAIVKFKKTRDAETRIDLVIKHLKQPEEMVPPGYLYVAWVRGDKVAPGPLDYAAWVRGDKGVPAVNIGALQLNKDLTGELRTVIPLHRFDFFVTVESAPDIGAPTGAPLLWSRYEE